MHDASSSAGTLAVEAAPMKPENNRANGGPKSRSDRPTDKPTIDVDKLPKIRRSRYVIDRRRQYRTALLTSGLAMILLIIVNTAFTVLRSSQTMVISAAAPQLESTLSQQDARVGMMLILVSIIFVIGVFAITIAETHRTAGAVYAVHRALERVVDGDYCTPLRLRPNDNLRDLRAPFNEMISTLRKTALADAEELDELAQAIASGTIDRPTLAERLTKRAAVKRALGGPGSTA